MAALIIDLKLIVAASMSNFDGLSHKCDMEWIVAALISNLECIVTASI